MERAVSQPQNSDQTEPLWPLGLLLVAVLAILVIVGTTVFHVLDTWEHRGQFGDMFGVANTLFSGLAFAALTYTLLLQRRELSLQRLELSLTRAELARQTEAQAAGAAHALLAARIGALSALLQSYTVLITQEKEDLVQSGWLNSPRGALRDVQQELRDLLEQHGA